MKQVATFKCLSLGMCIFILSSFCQAQYTVNNLQILPSNPTETDSIFIITNVSTFYQGISFGNQIIQNTEEVIIEGCYIGGSAASPSVFIDTLNIGIKPLGDYSVTFNAHYSTSWDSCTYSDVIVVDTTFSSQLVGTGEILNSTACDLQVYPNPCSDILHIKSESSSRIKIIGITGIEISCPRRKENGILTSLDTSHLQSGIYFVMFTDCHGELRTERFVKN